MWDDVFDRVRVGLKIRGKTTGKEWRVVRNFVDSIRDEIGGGVCSPFVMVLVEEAVVSFVLSNRLLLVLCAEGVVGEKGKLAPGFDAWFKVRERLRRVMKDLMARYGKRDGVDEVSVAELMGPVLDLGEGVLEDVLELGAAGAGEERIDGAGRVGGRL